MGATIFFFQFRFDFFAILRMFLEDLIERLFYSLALRLLVFS